MESTTENFFKILFDEGEYTCFTSSPKGTKVFPVNDKRVWSCEYFCLNPLDGHKDNDPHQEWHSPDKPRRADVNVTNFRNILLEMDTLSPQEQLSFISNEAKLPHSTAVYSGGKSIHFIISLEEPLSSKDQYTDLVCKIYKALNKIRPDVIDQANKNPSRLTRTPNAFREDKNKTQELLYVRTRIPNSQVIDWLKRNLTEEELLGVKKPYVASSYNLAGHLSPWAKNVMMGGIPMGQRNTTCFKLACEFFRQGWSHDEILTTLQGITDLPYREIVSLVQSASRITEQR
jgi:hypothetical protein